MSVTEPQDEVLHSQGITPEPQTDAPLPTPAPADQKEKSRVEKIFGPPADTKTIFDSLRNMGICIAMLLGLPTLYKSTYYLYPKAQAYIGCFVIGMAIPLTAANLAWTFRTLEQKSSKVVNIFIVILGCLIISFFAFQALESLPSL